MSSSQQVWQQQATNLTEQSKPEVITHWMNRYLSPKGITAKVILKDGCMGILLESDLPPDREETIALVRQGLDELKLELIQTVRVYGRRANERLLSWQQEIEAGAAQGLQLKQIQEIVAGNAVAPSSISDWLSQGQTIDHHLLVDEAILPAVEAERFLRFQIGFEDTALLPLASVKEVLQISVEEILPVPDMPNCVLGIYNCRGEMLWLVDLEIQIGLFSLARNSLKSQHLALRTSNMLTTIAIQADDKSLGIVVPQVMDIEEHSPEALQIPPTGLFPPKLLPLIQRYLTDSSSPVLDTKALIQDSQLQMHHLN